MVSTHDTQISNQFRMSNNVVELPSIQRPACCLCIKRIYQRWQLMISEDSFCVRASLCMWVTAVKSEPSFAVCVRGLKVKDYASEVQSHSTRTCEIRRRAEGQWQGEGVGGEVRHWGRQTYSAAKQQKQENKLADQWINVPLLPLSIYFSLHPRIPYLSAV